MLTVDKKIDISLDVDIKCNNCGNDLDVSYDYKRDVIYVNKCNCSD